MKLRAYLLLASACSIGFILAALLISYYKMLLNLSETVWLTGITLAAAGLSLLLHFVLTRPLETSVKRITEETAKIASGDFKVEVPVIGPLELRMLAEQFNGMSKQLQASFGQLHSSEAARRELIVGVSHDLRTPLASIRSYVEALQDGVIQDRPTFERYLSTLSTETQRLGALIDDLFQWSRLEAGAEAFAPEPYHLDRLIVEALDAVKLQLDNKRMEAAADIPERIPPAWIMPGQVRRVLANLLDNAIRHSPKGSTISLKVRELPGGMLEVAVKDEGEGIPEEEQERIFERFYRTDKSRQRDSGGSGLGLAIARTLIERHGGRIGVISSKGRGSTFWFQIPSVIASGQD